MSTRDTPSEDETRLDSGPSSLGDGAGSRLRVLVIGEHVIATHPVPERGVITLGRSPKADVMIDEPSISRLHAKLHLGPEVRIEDLGSSNGTLVGGRRLEPNQPELLVGGVVVQLGRVTIAVQRQSQPPRQRRLWTHDYFEARLDEECARASRNGRLFALVCVHCDGPPADEGVVGAIGGVIRGGDVVAEYGPNQWEILLLDTDTGQADQVLARVREELARHGVKARSAIAWFPRDGRSPDALSARARSLVTGVDDQPRGGAQGPLVADPVMRELHQLLERLASGSITVLILGETGAGKEVLAERLHQLSPRASKPFLRLNCAALSESLLESELFGHERGAFTSAVTAKPGLLETADGGTVFLDEVGELPLTFQVKLLRVLETRQVTRVGGLKPRALDVRFVAATNRDLEAEVGRGTFRQDLFYRLNGATLVVPPLRERPLEIVELARVFALEAAKAAGRTGPVELHPDAVRALQAYSWPGNVRELRNVIERAVLLCGGGAVETTHLPMEKMTSVLRASTVPPAPRTAAVMPGAPAKPAPTVEDGGDGPTTADDERRRILAALAQCAGNQTHAAQALGISRRTLINRLEQFGIARPRKRRGV